MDQIAALQWVKDNIKVFGGEMSSVTLMGHSTGAACVNFLMLSPVARGNTVGIQYIHTIHILYKHITEGRLCLVHIHIVYVIFMFI